MKQTFKTAALAAIMVIAVGFVAYVWWVRHGVTATPPTTTDDTPVIGVKQTH